MRLTVNGEPREIPAGTTVDRLLAELHVAPGQVVVERNLKVLKRAELPATVLEEGDQLEIVHFVGGGA
jgi:thiamine biosynthesis protein ThiS